MAITKRLFGFTADPTSGGTDYDTFVATTGGGLSSTWPAVTEFWPVTGTSLDRNVERIDRTDEARGRRGGTVALPFRSRPVLTVPVRAYLSSVTHALFKTIGPGAGYTAPTGSASAGYTHTFFPQAAPSVLPAVVAQLIRDDLNSKIAGGYFNRITLTFPLDGEGTMECEIQGKYDQNLDTNVVDPALVATFTGTTANDTVLMLRDAKAWIDQATPTSLNKLADLQGIEFTFNNNIDPRFYAGRNVVTQTFSGGYVTPQTRKVWYPTEYRLQGMEDVTMALTFGTPQAAQEIAMDFAQIQKFQFDIVGAPIAGTTGPVSELLRITIYNGIFTGGGTADLSPRDIITSRFEVTAGWDEIAGKDVQIDVVNGQSTPLV